MTQEEKAKAYDEALERAREIHNEHKAQPFNIMTKVFPELKESEDEKIRKELIDIVAKSPITFAFEDKEKVLAWLEKQGEQEYHCTGVGEPKEETGVLKQLIDEEKSAWSEEDEYMLNETIQHLEELIRIDKAKHCSVDVQYYQRDIDWLKSLKDRVQPQPKQEWSEEDERAIGIIKIALEHPYDMEGKWDRKFALDWIKSLKDRYTWKPSDEQMKFLKELVEDNNQRYFYTTLRSLYEQLKTLKGE